MHVAPRGGFWNPEYPADFLERQAFLVAKHDRGPLVGPQPGERLFERAAERPLLDRVGGGKGRDVGRGIAGAECRRGVGGPGTPERVEARVVRDAKQPARETPRRVERRQAAEGLDERFLREILGERLVAGQPDEQAEDRPLVAPDDLLERLLGSRQRLGDQPGLDDGLEINRDGRVPRRPAYPSLRAGGAVCCRVLVSGAWLRSGVSHRHGCDRVDKSGDTMETEVTGALGGDGSKAGGAGGLE